MLKLREDTAEDFKNWCLGTLNPSKIEKYAKLYDNTDMQYLYELLMMRVAAILMQNFGRHKETANVLMLENLFFKECIKFLVDSDYILPKIEQSTLH